MTAALPVTLFVTTLLATGTTPTPGPAELNPVVLTVNGEPVHAADISLVMKGLIEAAGPDGQKPKPDDVIETATQRVVEQKLLAQEARRLGLHPDEKRVARALEVIVQEAGGRAALDASLAGGGTSYERLAESVREMDLAKVYVDTRIRPSITVTDDDVASAYQSHPERFGVAERVHARHILVKVAENADSATVEAARQRAEAAHDEAVAGKDFAALARELSDCPSAPHGGDLGTFTADKVVDSFAKAAFVLKPGEISPVVRTPFGFHVIKVEERLPAGITPLEEARPNLRKALAAAKAAEVLGEVIKRLTESATIEPVAGGPSAPAVGS